MTKTGWLKCQWCGVSPPPDDSPLPGSRGRIWETYIILSAICQNTAFWTACRVGNWKQLVLMLHGGFHRRCILLFCNARFACVRSKFRWTFCAGHLDRDSAPHTLIQNCPFLPIGLMKTHLAAMMPCLMVFVKF